MQISRLIEMIHILLDKRAVTAAELAEHFEISVRTVYRDIEALSQAGFPVYAERGRSGGIRITEGYSLDKSVLTDEEKTELIGALAGFAALGASDSRAASHIRAFFGGAEEPDWVQIDFSDWGSSQQELYADIKKCIFEKRRLSFDYYNSMGEKSRRSTFPVQLRFRSKTWYLSAYCFEKQAMRLFKLRRMKNAAVGDICERPNISEEITEAPDYSYVRKITLKISGRMAYRVYDEFDEDNITKNSDGSFPVTCSYIVDDWVYGMILSYGEYCEVLSPDDIRETAKEKINAMKNVYGE